MSFLVNSSWWIYLSTEGHRTDLASRFRLAAKDHRTPAGAWGPVPVAAADAEANIWDVKWIKMFKVQAG